MKSQAQSEWNSSLPQCSPARVQQPATREDKLVRRVLARRKVYLSVGISRRWGDSSQNPTLTSLLKPVILLGSWWEFGTGRLPRGRVDVRVLVTEGSGRERRGVAQFMPRFTPLLPVSSLNLH